MIKISEDLTTELLETLRKGASDTIDLFVVSFVFGLLVIVIIGVLLYKTLWKKR